MPEDCHTKGREHLMFSALAMNQVVTDDWCIRCGRWDADTTPRVVIRGERRSVEDVNPAEGLL